MADWSDPRIALQRLTKLRERELLVRVVLQNTDTRQRPHESMEHACIGSHKPSELCRGFRTIRQMIGDAELGRRPDQSRNPTIRSHLDELNVRRNNRCFFGHITETVSEPP